MLYQLSYASELLTRDDEDPDCIQLDTVRLGRIESETQDKNERVT